MTSKFYLKCALAIFFVTSQLAVFAQNQTDLTGVWKETKESNLNFPESERPIFPLRYRTLALDLQKLKTVLANAPQAYVGDPVDNLLKINLPMPDGSFEEFLVFNAPIMEKPLADQHPEIQTYCGRGVKNPGESIRFDITPYGFHAQILSREHSTVYIDPYATTTTDFYTCYYKKDYARKVLPDWTCGTVPDAHPKISPAGHEGLRYGDCKFRRYRLALAGTIEYSQAVTGLSTPTQAQVLAKMVTSVARVNGIYEVELAVTMILVANNTNIIYVSGTDPYTNGNGSTMLGENQTNCDAVIGTANYDIGHVFSTGGGGVANLQAPCDVAIKGRGVTGSSTPQGDVYDVDYVAHEMGHQFGSNHTFAGNAGSCAGNANSTTAYEPGSGSTIMAYAGICTAPQNVQTFGQENSNIYPPGSLPSPGASDDYFHASSLREINIYITNTAVDYGGFCPVQLGTGALPSLPTLTNYSIPASTPFTLPGTVATGTGTMYYCWEQYNASTSAPVPVVTSTTGVNFRSYLPVTSTDRTVPALTNILGGTNTNTWEKLPSVARTLTWNYTVRAIQSVGGVNIGCTANKTNTVTTCAGASLAVTSPNSTVTYDEGSTQNITWTTGCATCANVDILISTDGGITFSTLLATTPNDGTQSVTIPTGASTTARIKIKCSNNIFFDVSNTNFIIAAVTPAPIQLLSFRAESAQKSIQLRWATANELNFKGFSLERSSDPKTGFTPITWESAKGGSTQYNYNFVDKNVSPNVVYYYRLKQLDNDGSFNYSNIESAQLSGKSDWNVSLTPNPATAEFKIELPDNKSVGDLKISILASNGQLLREQTLTKEELEQHRFDISMLQSGIYLIKISDESQTIFKKLVKK